MAGPSEIYDRETLCALLAARSFKRGRFQLSSGAWSRIYFNLKPTMLVPEGARQCALGLIDLLRPLSADYVAGLEMGAVPLLGAVAAFGGPPAVFIRKAPKAYGSLAQVEGLDEVAGETLSGKRVVVIDDVATSGASIIKTIDPVAAAGGIVTDALVILDREQGAAAMLAERGIRLHTLFTAGDLGVTDADRAPID